MQQNGMVVLGTDFPVEGVNPLATFFAATQRRDAAGNPKNGFQTENALSPIETLKGMTIWAAYGNFEENEKGTIEVGKYADFTVLDKDIMKEVEVLKIKILGTWIGGERLF